MNMRNVPFLFLSILLFSCGGNGNKSEKNQEIMDMDSTELVVIDTMVTSPRESKDKAEESTRVKTKDSIVGLYYCKKSGDTYVLNDDYSGLFLPKSGNSCTIDWYKTGNSVTVTFTGKMEFLGTQRLDYNKNGKVLINNSSLKFEITAKRLYAASQRVL